MKTLLLTGGAGFVGSHIVEGVLKNTDWDIVVLDRLDISGNLERLRDMKIWEDQKERVRFVWWDLKAPLNPAVKNQIGKIDYIWHLAASSHVDRSIEDPLSFVMDNVVGTCNLLNYAREVKPERTIVFGTDEIFGPAPEGTDFKEWDRYKSQNPYAASKAGEEELAIAFENTYGLDIIITHTQNIFGERQHSEKYIPLCIKKIQSGEEIKVHSYPDLKKAGSRYWIHARNVCQALLFLTNKGKSGDKYNIVGEVEIDNLKLAKKIAKIIDKPIRYKLVDFHSSRPGHDTRYALSGEKLKKLGFEYPLRFDESFEKTIKWYLENPNWL